jgi:hypothetical protein
MGFEILSGQTDIEDNQEPTEPKPLLTPSLPLINKEPKQQEQTEPEIQQKPEQNTKPKDKTETSSTTSKRKKNTERTSIFPEKKSDKKSNSVFDDPPKFFSLKNSPSFNTYMVLIITAIILVLILRQPSSVI